MGILKLSIRCSTGPKFEIEVDEKLTVGEFKKLLEETSNVPASEQRLIYKGRVLNDNGTLEHFAVLDGDAVHLVQGSSQQQSSTTSPASGSSANASAAATSPFAGLGGMGGAAGMPGMEGMQSMLRENPEFIQNMMNSPLMQNLMDNPEIFRSMMMSNPQMRAVMENNPHLSHVLNDPDLLRQSMNAARNPNVMQEMMRNQDRAMQNIESLPGGYNALRRMYHDVQEPMMEAAEQHASQNGSSSQQDQDVGVDPDADPESTPMPNPWGGGDSARPGTANRNPRQRNAAGTNPFTGMGMPPWPFPTPGNANSGSQATPPPFPPDFIRSMMMGQNNPWNMGAAPSPAGANASSSASSGSSTTAAAASTGPSIDGPNPWAPASSADSPEQKYKVQLEQMESMGFPDKKANIQALLRNNGVVNLAVESLIEDQSK